MENNIPGTANGITIQGVRDKKNARFFRKSGTSSATTTPVSGHPARAQPQRSFDSCSPLYGTPLQMIGQQNIDPALLASLANGLNRHHHQQQMHAASMAGSTINSPSASAAQSPVIFNEHDTVNGRRFMAAPRRARSAERFDGMRIACSASGDLSSLSRQSPAGTPTGSMHGAAVLGGESALLYRNNRSSPQVLRAGMVENGGSSGVASPAPSLPLQPQLRQSAIASPVPSLASTTNSGPIPSPPPPYSKAITETHISPPSYKQAVAAAAMSGKVPHGKNSKILANGNNRYNLTHRGQSLDMANYGQIGSAPAGASLINGNTVATPGTNGLRSVSSHPVFLSDSSNEVICNCHKCQALARERGNDCNDLNDAVYMESQAFLMHEIMNDGMAFCSVM